MTTKLPKIDPQFFQTYEETKNWLDEMWIKKYTINPETLEVNVDAHVSLLHKNLSHLPVQFGKIEGNFWCYSNQLTSLKGSPEYVKGVFSCCYNNLTSLEYCPQYVEVDFWCDNNPLSSLDELINCDIKENIHYTYNNNLSPIFECKENRYYDNDVEIPFVKLKEFLIIKQEKKLLDKNLISNIITNKKLKI